MSHKGLNNNDTANSELIQLDPKKVEITKKGDQFLEDQILVEVFKDRIEALEKSRDSYKAEVDRITTEALKVSNKYEETIKAKDTQQQLLLTHLSNMLSEHEAEFDRKGNFESIEFAMNYVEAATAARKLGRVGDRIDYVLEWVNSEDSLPFEKEINSHN